MRLKGKTSAELPGCILHLQGLVLMLGAMGSLPGIGAGSGTQRTLATYWGTWLVKASNGPFRPPCQAVSVGQPQAQLSSREVEQEIMELVAGQGQTVRELAFSIAFSTLSK